MLYIVFLTARCNLKCTYCGGSIEESIMPPEITYRLDELVEFISQDSSPSIAFYGGEPLLRADLMMKIMDSVEAEHFILQTNGLLLHKVDVNYLRKFSTILVSIDGRQEVTDHYRGGVYDRVIRNVRWVRKVGYEGELIARMVATEKTDIYSDVLHLLSIPQFSHVHWQIDAVWSPDSLWRDFTAWVKKYNSGISRLASYFISRLKEGEVLGIVPFLGVLKAILFQENMKPPCGSGIDSFAITTDGRIVACPVCADMPWNQCGDIATHYRKLMKVYMVEPCLSCEYSFACGGRCLFFNRERLWGDEGFRLVCSTARHLIEEMMEITPEILKLSEQGMVELNEFYYPKFNNTTEIIP